MAYKNVGTPRFYVNVVEWMASQKVMGINDIMRTLPVYSSAGSFSLLTESLGMRAIQEDGFIAILGHNIKNNEAHYYLSNGEDGAKVHIADIMNAGIEGGSDYDSYTPSYDGFSIGTFNGTDVQNIYLGFNTQIYAGSIVIGTFYDMPHSPDLSLSLSYEYGGIDEITTKGGNTLTNATWTRPPHWGIPTGAPGEGDYASWTLRDPVETGYPEHLLTHSARRIWDLSFSFIQDSDIFAKQSSTNPKGSSTPEGVPWSDGDVWHNYQSLLDSNTFFSRVVHKTNGGQLPFIFNPSGGGTSPNNNPDMFAIAKLDMKSFQFKQVANGVYNMKLKIREVW